MKKILLPILITIVMICSAMPALATFWDNNPAYQQPIDTPTPADITTYANIAGGSTAGAGGVDPPLIKVAWQYDMNIALETSSTLCCTLHDADPNMPRLQVAPILGHAVTVGYFAVVTATSTMNPDSTNDAYVHTYVDVWHPDGQYKYQIELQVVGASGSTYDKSTALTDWDHVTSCHYDLLRLNAALGTDPQTVYKDVHDELDQCQAYLYYGEGKLCYCQPGGDYLVGTTAMRYNTQSATLYNTFWYIPTSAVEIDFNTVTYDKVVVGHFQQAIGGDYDMSTHSNPTVRNVGNTPIYLTVQQDDTQFSQTNPGHVWNVQYQARMGDDGTWTGYYWPNIATRIPGTLPMCTLDKLDFGILVTKATPGVTYQGTMQLTASIDMTGFWPTTDPVAPGHIGEWATHSKYIGTPMYPIPQIQPTPFTWAWVD